jgi:hypothetical protein
MYGMNTQDHNAVDDRSAARRRAAASESAAHDDAVGQLRDQTDLMMAGGVVALGIRNHKMEMTRLQSKFDAAEDARKDVSAVATASKRATDLLIAELAAATGESIEQISARVDRNKNREYNRLVSEWVSTDVFRVDPRLNERNYANRRWYTPTP